MTTRTLTPLARPARGGGLAGDSIPQALVARFAPQLLVTAALLSVGAAVIHASVAGPHYAEYAPFGLLFLASALAQTVWAVFVLAAPSARLLASGVAGNGGILAAWALSRTTGLPVGPEPGTPEPVGALDIAASAFELGLVGSAVLLILARRPLASPGQEVKHFAAIGAAAILVVTAAAIAREQRGAGHDAADRREAPALAGRRPARLPAGSGVRANTAKPATQSTSRTSAAPIEHAPTTEARRRRGSGQARSASWVT